MKLPIALGSYRRDLGFLPELRLRNLIVEKTPADDEGVVLLPRPGLKTSYSVTGSSIVSIWTEPGVFNGDVFTLTSDGLFRGGGFVSSTATPSKGTRFAAVPGQMVFATGGVLYRYDGTSLTTPVFPGSAVGSVAVLDNYFFAVQRGTRQFYWSAIADATSWPALNFASAESHSGALLDIIPINDQLALICQGSVEFWQANPTGDITLPFVRIDGLTLSRGALNQGASCYVDNTLVWVGNDGIVYRRGAVPQRISDHGIEEQVAASSAAYLSSFAWTGHTFLILQLDQACYLYDFATGEWSEASSYGFAGWRAQCACFNGISPVFGDSAGPNVLVLDSAQLYDVDAAIERRFTAVLPDQAIIDNLWLEAQGGIGTEPSGNAIIVEMAVSRDGSQTWSEFLDTNLGKRGEYRKRAAWRRLGRYDMGAVFDFRCTDPAPFTIQSVRINEPLAGRGV